MLREVLLLAAIDCPGYKHQKSVGVLILRKSRYTGSLVEKRFIPEFLSSSKFQYFLRFTKIFQAKLSLQVVVFILNVLLSSVVSKKGQ